MVTSSGGVGTMARFNKKKTTYISCRAELEKEGKPWGIIFYMEKATVTDNQFECDALH